MSSCKKAMLVILFILPLSLFAGDRDIFYVYFHEAYDLFKAGHLNESRNLLKGGLEFWPDAPDGLVLQALLDIQSSADRSATAKEIKNLAKNPGLQFFSSHQIFYWAGVWFYIAGDYGSALESLSSVMDPELKDEAWNFYLFDSRLRTGKTKEAAASAKYLAARFGESLRIQQFAVRADLLWAQELAGRIMDGSYSGPFRQEMTLYLLDQLPVGNTMENLLIFARQNGIKGDAVTVADYLYGYPDRQKLIKDYLSNKSLDAARTAHFYNILTEEDKIFWEKSFQSWTGEILLDRDRDGHAERTVRFVSGLLTAFSEDSDQNGITEQEIIFSKGMLQSINIITIEGPAVLKYGFYPYLSSVTLTGPDAKTSWYLAERISEYPIAPGRFYPWLEDKISVWPVKEDFLIKNCERREIRTVSTGELINVREYLEGSIILERIATTGHGQLDKKVLYSGGKPYLGFRDLDWDGIFDITEIYENGILTSLEYKEQGQNVPELVMMISPQRNDLWDLNDDGMVDFKVEYKSDVTIKWFSTGLNGYFDIGAEEKNGVIVRIIRKSVAIFVTESSDKLLWIGPKGNLDFKTAASKSGTVIVKGVKYRIFLYNGRVYAEIVS